MTPSEIVQYARTLSGCRVDEIPDADLYRYLNVEYRKLRQDVAGIDKNYKLRTLTTNLVTGVSSYALSLPVQAPWVVATGQIKIDTLHIKYYNSITYPVRAIYRDWDNLDRSPEWYAVNQSTANPFYIITDNSVQIFPTPTDTVIAGLIMTANQRPYDLTSTMTEADILIEREYHDVIAFAVIPYVYQHRQQDDRVAYYQQQLELKKRPMLTQLKKRLIRPMKWFNATFNEYIY